MLPWLLHWLPYSHSIAFVYKCNHEISYSTELCGVSVDLAFIFLSNLMQPNSVKQLMADCKIQIVFIQISIFMPVT